MSEVSNPTRRHRENCLIALDVLKCADDDILIHALRALCEVAVESGVLHVERRQLGHGEQDEGCWINMEGRLR
jgi:hypothetical protein